MSPKRLILEYVYEHERELADRVFLTQPVGVGWGWTSSRPMA